MEDSVKEIIVFLKKRAEELYKLGGVHVRESVALYEAAMIIEMGMHKE